MTYKGRELRPLWQIAVLLPAYPFYWAARQFVNLYEALTDAL
jgi:hypothetical protein